MTSALPTWAHELGPARLLGGKYRLVRLLGVGGMGAVWAARNVATGAQVAIKVLLEQSGNAELVERMRREAYATASLSHRGIVRVYDLIDVGPAGGQSAMVMELLQGRTLAEYLHERGRLSEEEAVAIVLPVLSALEHAHGRGVTHRDLKPENVFLAVESDAVMTPKILDFGISKLRVRVAPNITHQGQLLGTPSYMSPEQVRGSAEVDERSDIFSMGILLYEMLSGRNPFAGDGQQPVLVAILEGHPAPLTDVTPALWNVIARALCKNPDDRFACAEELGAALRRAVGLPPASASDSTSMPEPSWRPSVFTPAPSEPAPKAALLTGTVGAVFAGAALAAALAAWMPSQSPGVRTFATAPPRLAAPAAAEPEHLVPTPARAAAAHVDSVPAAATRDAGHEQTPTASSKSARSGPRVRQILLAREPGF